MLTNAVFIIIVWWFRAYLTQVISKIFRKFQLKITATVIILNIAILYYCFKSANWLLEKLLKEIAEAKNNIAEANDEVKITSVKNYCIEQKPGLSNSEIDNLSG